MQNLPKPCALPEVRQICHDIVQINMNSNQMRRFAAFDEKSEQETQERISRVHFGDCGHTLGKLFHVL